MTVFLGSAGNFEVSWEYFMTLDKDASSISTDPWENASSQPATDLPYEYRPCQNFRNPH